MAEADLRERIASRVAPFGVTPSTAALDGCVQYLELLARWNRRINLTALPLEPPTDEALDRLIGEPVVAAARVPFEPGAAVLDVGSGAGSPAIPLKLMRPDLRLWMVEARARKSAFLREAVRTLALADVPVLTERVEDLGRMPELVAGSASITVRAVRLDDKLLDQLRQLLTPGGKLLYFTTLGVRPNSPRLQLQEEHELPGRARLLTFDVLSL